MKTKLTLIITIFVFALGIESNAQTYNPNQDTIQAVKNELLGQWVRKDNSMAKIKFTQDGRMEQFEDGEKIMSNPFEVSLSCDNNNAVLPGAHLSFYLLTFDDTGTIIRCDIIAAVNVENSGILSIITKNGRHIVYKRP